MSRKFERKTRELLGTAAEPAGVMAGACVRTSQAAG